MRKLIYLLAAILFFTTKNSSAQFVEAQQCIGGNGNDVIVDVQKTADGGLIVLVNTTSKDGDFADNTENYANALIKLNSHYEIEWKKSYGDTNAIALPGLIQHEQDYYLLYLSYQYGDSVLNYQNYYNLTRIDANGNKLWNRTYEITGLSNMYAYSALLALPDIKFLKNNTIAFSTIVDTAFLLHNIDKDGNTIWDLRYDYDTLFRDGSSSWWGYPFFTFNNFVAELNNNTILLTNAMSDFCMWFCSNTVSKTHFINIDYSGELIKERYSDTLLPINYNKIVNEDTNNIYYLDANGYSTKINKNDLSFEMTYLQQGQMITIYDYIFNKDTAIQNDIPLYLNTEYDSMGNSTYFLQKYDLVSNTILYKTLLDTFGNGRYLSYNAAYYLPNNGYIIIYSKDNIYKIVKLDNSGNITYNKLLSSSIRPNENNTGFMLYMSAYYFYPLIRVYNIGYDNKLYTYNTWSYYDTAFNTIYTQKFFIHDIETGELEYEYTNDMKDTLLYKYITPYPDKKNELFVLADLNGQNTCKLGGYDIKMFQVISATNKILGKAFIDYNSNNIQDNGEPPYRLAYLESSKNNYSLSTYMYGNNYTINYADTGTWITRLIPHHTYYDIHPLSFITSHADFGNNDTVIFAMHPTRTVNDLKISLINSFITRLGNTTTYEIAYANEGTHPANGTVKLVLDGRLNFASSNPNLTSQNGDTLIWDFSNLQVNETRKIIVHSAVPVPPTLNVGDSLHSIVFIEPSVNDSTPNDNHAALDEVIPGFYDPNDKTSTTGENITPAQIQRGDYITYVVRFQNIGNDTAFRIVIEDTLDANLDWSTLQPVNTSHPFSMQVINKNVIQFTFTNLKLPPASINEAASHGFIAYKVKPKSDVAQGSIIKNTAHIYFDFNSPVTTNTVNTNVVLLSAVKNNIKNEGKISVYPNPNNGIFNLEFTANYTSPLSVTIIDITGKIVYRNQLQHLYKSIVTINTDNLSSGLYSVVLKTDKEQFTEKIIIDK